MNSLHFSKKLICMLLLILTLIGLSSISVAVTSRTYFQYPKYLNVDPKNSAANSRILPSVSDLSGPTQAMPQYWGLASSNPYREVTLDDSRLLLTTNQWQATVSNGSVVYCADFAHPIRTGTWHDTKHYLLEGQNFDNYYTHVSWNAEGMSILKQRIALIRFFDNHMLIQGLQVQKIQIGMLPPIVTLILNIRLIYQQELRKIILDILLLLH